MHIHHFPHTVNLILYFGVLVPLAITALSMHFYASRPGGPYERWSLEAAPAPDPATHIDAP